MRVRCEGGGRGRLVWFVLLAVSASILLDECLGVGSMAAIIILAYVTLTLLFGS